MLIPAEETVSSVTRLYRGTWTDSLLLRDPLCGGPLSFYALARVGRRWLGGPGLASEKPLSPFFNHFDAASSLAAPSFPPS